MNQLLYASGSVLSACILMYLMMTVMDCCSFQHFTYKKFIRLASLSSKHSKTHTKAHYYH